MQDREIRIWKDLRYERYSRPRGAICFGLRWRISTSDSNITLGRCVEGAVFGGRRVPFSAPGRSNLLDNSGAGGVVMPQYYLCNLAPACRTVALQLLNEITS